MFDVFFRIQTGWQFLTRLQPEDYHFRQKRDVEHLYTQYKNLQYSII